MSEAGPPREGLATRLARAQFERPWAFIGAGLLLAGLSLPLILGVPGVTDGLTLNSDFTSLLPESAQSVRDLDQIQARFDGQQPITLVVEAEDTEALRRFVRALAPRIEALRDEHVVAVDWNVGDFATFVEEHRHLYADLEDLTRARGALDARLEYERARANPFYIDLDDEEPPPDPEAVVRDLEAEAETARAEMNRRFPEGLIQHPSRSLLLLVVHARIRGGDAAKTQELITAIQREIDALEPASYAPDLRVRWGGPLMEVREETESLLDAVRTSILLTLALTGLAIFVFFLRGRPIPLLLIGLVPPLLLTFGIAELTVDYLNASSAFLSAIVVGNGINPNVMWLARYFEARRDGLSVQDALRTCHAGTWKGTLAASLAASVAYGSLLSTDYRGFRDFGLVGGIGMVLCWLGAYLFLPAITVVSERLRPLRFAAKARARGIYGILFARLALSWPRAVLGVSLLLTVASAGLVAWAVREDPMEHDFRRLRSERPAGSDVEYVTEATRAVLDDTKTGSALVVLAPRHADVPRYRAQLEAYRRTHPRDFGVLQSIDDLLPADQEEKLRLLRALRRSMREIRPHLSPELQARVDEHLPPADLRALTPDDLPASVSRVFTERDGTRGRLLFIEHHPEESSFDGRYMQRWAAAARVLRSEGETSPPPVAGTAAIFNDLTETVWRDAPRAILIAFGITAFLVLFTFRTRRERWLTVLALSLGVLWMAGVMVALGMKLNFLNVLAFPITFGNGVDYAVNVLRRYVEEKRGATDAETPVRAAIEETGGAVILCSLTTVIGYISIHASSNQALNSFGLAMGISELTCLGAAVVCLPALLYVLDRRTLAAAPDAPPPTPVRF